MYVRGVLINEEKSYTASKTVVVPATGSKETKDENGTDPSKEHEKTDITGSTNSSNNSNSTGSSSGNS